MGLLAVWLMRAPAPVQLAIIWFARVVPATLLIVIGVSSILAGYVPEFRDWIGHAPLPLSIGVTVLGVLYAALQFYLVHLRRRYRLMIEARQSNAQGS
jgi:uncharacterized RDD family membrane protein YckC